MRLRPYLRPIEASPNPPFPSQSLSSVIRAEIRNVLSQGDISEPIVQIRTGLSDLQNRHQESLCAANQVVPEMQRVLSSCHSSQRQVGRRRSDSRQMLVLNTAQSHQIHMDQQREEHARSHITQQSKSDQERLSRTQQQHEQNYAQIQQFASQVGNQFQQLAHMDSATQALPSQPEWNTETRTPTERYAHLLGEPPMEAYPTPLMAIQRMASEPELGASNRQFGDLNTPTRGESQSYIPNAEISHVPAFGVSRYSHWVGRIEFWKGPNEYIPESQLISPMGLNGGTTPRPHAMKMFRGAEQEVALRTFQTLMSIPDDHYATTAREEDMAEMDRLFL